MSPEIFAALTQSSVVPLFNAPVRPSAAVDTDQRCQCMLSQVDASFQLTTAQRASMLAACQNDPDGLQQFLLQQGLSADCSTPFYKRPAVWLIGGAALVGGALILRAVL